MYRKREGMFLYVCDSMAGQGEELIYIPVVIGALSIVVIMVTSSW